MKAIVYTKYGGPEFLQLQEIDKPAPKENQVLVKVRAASVNALDYRRFTSPSGFGRFMDERVMKAIGTVLGADVAGTVEAVGSGVTEFKPGDEVFGVCAASFAEYAVAGETKVALKPANVTFEQAAAVPIAAFTALQGLRDKGQIKAGQKVLIDGASGGVGMLAVQIAKSFGAEVTAVCSTRNLKMARSIGADHVIDYKQEDFTQNGQPYDLILAVNGYHPMQDYQKALRPGGVCVVAGGEIRQIMQSMFLGPLLSLGGKRIIFQGIARTPKADLLTLRELLEAGKINPVIDKSYPLGETAEAVRYLVNEHAQGKVVITVDHSINT